MEGAVKKHAFSNGVQSFPGKPWSKFCSQIPSVKQRPASIAGDVCSLVYLELPQMRVRHNKHHAKVSAARRRRQYFQSETYVLMEPGKSEEFVSEEELKVKLTSWLENWPGNVLPPDLARFKTVDDAVTHLIKSVCELEIDGEVGSIQWYQVRLEGDDLDSML